MRGFSSERTRGENMQNDHYHGDEPEQDCERKAREERRQQHKEQDETWS